MRPRKQHWTFATVDGIEMDCEIEGLLLAAYDGRAVIIHEPSNTIRAHLSEQAKRMDLIAHAQKLAGNRLRVLPPTDREAGDCTTMPRLKPAGRGKREMLRSLHLWLRNGHYRGSIIDARLRVAAKALAVTPYTVRRIITGATKAPRDPFLQRLASFCDFD